MALSTYVAESHSAARVIRRPEPRHLELARPNHRREIAVVILTQGTRPAELERAVASVRAQRGVDLELVMVINGADRPYAGAADRLLMLTENVGIPAGRNLGAAAANANLVLFLDDDAELLDPELLATVVERFGREPGLGAMAIRLVDENGETQRRHIPRIGGGSATRSGEVTYFVGAACVVRADAFAAVGGFDARFFYAMEESDLAWRLLDRRWSIWYSADLRAFHPHTLPSRHDNYVRLTARNRFWIAWRSLPAPVLAAYLVAWTLIAVWRGAPVGKVSEGYREAWSARPTRRPMHWRTVARMTRLGRPPIL